MIKKSAGKSACGSSEVAGFRAEPRHVAISCLALLFMIPCPSYAQELQGVVYPVEDFQKESIAPSPVTVPEDVMIEAQEVSAPPLPEGNDESEIPNVDVSADEKSSSSPQWQSDFVKALSGNPVLMLSETQPLRDEEQYDLVLLDEAVAFALKNNYELKAAYEGLQGSYWDKMGAYSQYLPSVGFDVATGRERSRPGAYNDENGDRIEDTTHNRRDRNLSVRQPLIDLSIIQDIISSKNKEKIADYELLETRDTITTDTVNAYLQIVQSRLSIILADQYKAYLDELAERMRKRVEGGGAADADLDRILSRASIAESARVEAAGQYEINILNFRRLTGVSPSSIRIPDLLAPSIPENFEAALTSATEKNPAYLSAIQKVDLAKSDRNKSYAGLAPRVYAQYMSSYAYNAGGAAAGNPIDGVYPTGRSDSAMLVMQWNMNGGTAVTSGLAGSAKARQAQMEWMDILKRLQQGISTNYTAINATQKRLAVLQETVAANERVVVSYEEQFKNGTRPLFDMLDAYEQLYNSRINLLRVIFSYTQASYQIRQQMGDIVPSVLESKE